MELLKVGGSLVGAIFAFILVITIIKFVVTKVIKFVLILAVIGVCVFGIVKLYQTDFVNDVTNVIKDTRDKIQDIEYPQE